MKTPKKPKASKNKVMVDIQIPIHPVIHLCLPCPHCEESINLQIRLDHLPNS